MTRRQSLDIDGGHRGVDDHWQTIITALTSLLGGGFLAKIGGSAVAALRQRKRALGLSETRLDRALRSRYTWRDYAYHLRDLLRRHAPDEVPRLPDDPWSPTDNDDMTK